VGARGDDVSDDQPWPQAGRERMIVPAPIGRMGTGEPNVEPGLMARLGPDAVMMMGDNPALPRMPKRPTLMDFFRHRVQDVTFRHLLQSAKLALDAGQDEKIIMACLLHDISNGCLIRADHGYWGAQLVAPYVSEEVAWAVKYHQPLRYFADESVGFKYPDAYRRFFGDDFEPPDYLKRDHETAKNHRWYMSARLITIYDVYAFQDGIDIDPEQFTDIIGRNFRQPEDGLGFDDSPSAHMWRTMIWPNNFL
jgi:HD domain